MIPLVHGGLYMVRWTLYPPQPETVAMFWTDEDECDADETPRREWRFFGSDISGNVETYDVLSRLDVVPVAPGNEISASLWVQEDQK